MSVIQINSQNFETTVTGEAVLLDFYADWCGTCKTLAPVIDAIAREEGKVTVGKVNIDENRELADRFGIRSVPTLIIFKNGKQTERIVGACPKKKILETLL